MKSGDHEMSLKEENSFGPFFLSLLLLCFSIAACGGIVSAPNEKLTIESTFPENGDAGVDKDIQVITASFNKEMDASSLSTSSFFLKDETGAVISGTVASTGASATFRPTTPPLEALKTYTATLTSKVRDLSGDSIGQDFSWQFTLSNVTTLLSVVSVTPPNNSITVPVNISEVSVTFSKGVDPDTVIANTTFSLNHGEVLVPKIGTPTNGGRTFTFQKLSKSLDYGREYNIEIGTGITDASGKALDISNNPNPGDKPGTYVSIFTIEPDPGTNIN